MPIYEYECVSKRHRFEEMQSISARPLKKCRVCGGKVKKLISSTAFHLKGSGWYKTDYAPKAKKEGGEKESSPKPASEKKNESTKAS